MTVRAWGGSERSPVTAGRADAGSPGTRASRAGTAQHRRQCPSTARGGHGAPGIPWAGVPPFPFPHRPPVPPGPVPLLGAFSWGFCGLSQLWERSELPQSSALPLEQPEPPRDLLEFIVERGFLPGENSGGCSAGAKLGQSGWQNLPGQGTGGAPWLRFQH